MDADGTVGGSGQCVEPAGSIVTRVGVVFGCQDGAVLVSTPSDPDDADGSAAARFERIPYLAGTHAELRAATFDGRPGRPTVAAVAGSTGFCLLDTRERAWTLVPTAEPLAAVASVDDEEEHVVALGSSGRVHVFAGTTPLASTDPVAAVPVPAAPAGTAPTASGLVPIDVDPNRAYLLAADGAGVLEIDYADAARVARVIPTADAAFVAEVGR